MSSLFRIAPSTAWTLAIMGLSAGLIPGLTACGPIKRPATEATAPASPVAPAAPVAAAPAVPGAVAPTPPVETDSSEKMLRRLEFFVLPGSEGDAARPRAAADTDRPIRRAIQIQESGAALVFPDPIVLDSGERFLSFREGSGDARWTSVVFQDGKRGYERLSFHFDPERRVWFLPLTRLFGPGSAPAEPGQPRELRLDLLTAAGRRLEVNLFLQVVLPLQDGLGVTEIRTLSLPSSPLELGQPALRGGIEVGAGLLANPFAHAVTFHVRAQESQPFRSDVVVWRRIHRENVEIGRIPFENNYVDINIGSVTAHRGGGRLQVGGLRVARRDGSLLREIALRVGQWGAVTLQPGEEVRVAWIAGVAEGERTCAMPQPGPAPEGMTPGENPFEGWREAWKLGWARLRGAMQWEVRLAGAEIPAREVTREEPSRQFRPWVSISRFAPLPLDVSAGDPRYTPRLTLECQGVL